MLRPAGSCWFGAGVCRLDSTVNLRKLSFIAATISVLAAQRFGEGFGVQDSVGTCPIPTLASNSKFQVRNELQIPEEASASEINTGIRLNDYSGITRQSLATTGFAARLV